MSKARTIWVSVLGFSSGRTAYVVTTGDQKPYKPGESRTPTGKEHDVFCRYEKKDRKAFVKVVKSCDQAKAGSYGGGIWKDVSIDELVKAAKGVDLMADQDDLAALMPDDDEGQNPA